MRPDEQWRNTKRVRTIKNAFDEKDYITIMSIQSADSVKVPAVYIAGPMTGYPEFNFPAFFAAQARFEKLGWVVWNPAAKDEEAKVHEMEAYKTGDAAASIAEGFDYVSAFEWDCSKVLRGNAIFMLKGWEKSTGARAEWAIAQFKKANDPTYEIMYEV